jgi:hypothetical protein
MPELQSFSAAAIACGIDILSKTARSNDVGEHDIQEFGVLRPIGGKACRE